MIKKIFFMLLCMFIASPAFPITDEQKQEAIKMQEKREIWLRKNREALRKEKELKSKKDYKIEIPEQKGEKKIEGELACFKINKVVFENSIIIEEKKLDQIALKYIKKKCLNVNDINDLIREITNLHIKKGYPTIRIVVDTKQNIKDGILKLIFINGYIESIEFKGGASFKEKMQLFSAFPFLEGKLLNLKKIEQGIAQLNRLPSNNITLNIEPGTKKGYSKIILLNRKQSPLRLNVTTDNMGQESTGIYRKKIGISYDNLLGINDDFSVSFMDNKKSIKDRFSEAQYLSYSFPLGYYTFFYDYSFSKYFTLIKGNFEEFETEGHTRTNNLKIKRQMYKGNSSSVSVFSALKWQKTRNYSVGELLEVSSKNNTVLTVGTDFTHTFGRNTINYDFNIHKGLTSLDAKEDSPDISNDEPREQFRKYTLNFNYKRYNPFEKLNIIYDFRFFSQYSDHPLYSAEKVSIGDQYTVRGFKEDSISGDNGFYFQNELTFNSPIFLPKWYLFFAYDYGWVQDKVKSESDLKDGEDDLAGKAVGLRFYGEKINFNIVYSKAISSANHIEKPKKEIYFDIGIRI